MEELKSEYKTLLSIETSGDVCSVALFRDSRLQIELAFRHEMRLSERLLAHVEMLLVESGATLDEVDCFAVGIGPGSFTGTRIGVMTVKTWAYFKPRPVAAITSLSGLAAEYAGLPHTTVVPILSCRAGVVYTAAYSVDQILPSERMAPSALAFSDLGAALVPMNDETILFCGPAARRYESELRKCLGAANPRAAFGAVDAPRASMIGRMALAKLAAGDPLSPALELLPLYVSPPPISQPKFPIPQAK